MGLRSPLRQSKKAAGIGSGEARIFRSRSSPYRNRCCGACHPPHPPVHTRIKICCIQSVEEAKLAVRAGAHAVGLVSAMPSGPGVISEEMIADLAPRLPPPVGTFLLTSETSPAAITDHYRRFRPTALQFVAPMEPSAYVRLRERLPGARFVPVVHVTEPASIDEAETLAPHADALLLDSGTPDSSPDEPRRLGGTGRTHDWAVSREIVDRLDTPVFLAGGLDPTNVGEAIRTVRPFGVDVCSGVRTDGNLDASKLHTFIQAVHSVAGSGSEPGAKTPPETE